MKRLMYSGVGLLLVAAAFLLFNMLSGLSLTNARLDLTEQKLYTISAGTEQILSELKEPISLQLYFSDKASNDLMGLRNYAKQVEEMLRAYQRAANGKLQLQVIDPEPFSEEEDQAAAAGLQGVPLNGAGDKLYFGLVGVNEAGDRLIIPFFQQDQEAFLEYELSRLVQTLANPQRAVVGVLAGLPVNGGFDFVNQQASPPWMLLEQVRQLFEVESIGPDVDQIPEQVSVLLLIHPKHLPQQTLYAIDQFVLRGGKLLAFVDPYSEADTGLGMPGEALDRGSDLEPLFEAWGLRMIPEKVVGDALYGMAVGMGPGQPPARHVGWLSLDSAALNAEDVATAGLETITYASGGALEPLEGATTRFEPLLQSSDQAMLFSTERFAVLTNPADLVRELQPTGERYTLAARIQGPAKSAFPNGIEGQEEGLKAADNINLIVVADSDLLTDRMWVRVQDFFGQRVPQPWADNGGFAINALDNLAGSEALISVRSRGQFSRPFVVVEALQREAEARFRQKEETLQGKLAVTEQQLAALQSQDDGEAVAELNAEQQQAIDRFLQEKLQIRKELREVRYQLNADIEELGRTLKILNIALVPALLTVAVLALALWRRRRG